MKLNEAFEGTGKVFVFTFRQLLKSKMNRVLLALIILISLASYPVLSLALKKDAPADEPEIPAVSAYREAGLTEEQAALMEKETYIRTGTWVSETAGEEDYDEIDETSYGVQTGYSIIMMMISVYAISYIVRAVIEEKSSKLVDLLLVSVKPAALLLGKILAVLAFVALHFGVLLLCSQVSRIVSGMFMDVSAVKELIGGTLNLNFKPDVLAVLILSALLGYLLVGVIAGISGAGCSNLEESGGAIGTGMIIVMIAYMASIFLGEMPNAAALRAACLIPVVSSFVAPLQYMYGNIGIGFMALSLVIEAVFCVLLIYVCAAVYRSLIVYKGTRLKFGQILRMTFKEGARS